MKFKIHNSLQRRGFDGQAEFKTEDLIKIILENRGIKSKKEIEEFLNPKLSTVTAKSVGINKSQLKKAIARIKKAIKNKEQIVVFGDYDVDGICGTAILWETLNSLHAKVTPYIPHRIDEGYGISLRSILNIKNKIANIGLIITVDNGIVANKAVEFANKQGIDVIITDHHVPSKQLPKALAIVHTTKLCGTGVAYLLAQELARGPVARFPATPVKQASSSLRSSAPPVQALPATFDVVGSPSSRTTPRVDNHLELVALATVADLVPLKEANRTLLTFGLEALRKTKRVGLLELFKEAGLEKQSIGVYEIGHMIAPRLNAMGRLEYAMDSLRLLCTNNQKRAAALAKLLGSTNKERQDLTLQSVLHATQAIRDRKQEIRKLLFISHKTYEQGVIGLVAGKLVEQYYRPSIVVSIGEKFSKASARSISGFNIVEFIREHSSYLVDAGGHPMAAGFTVKTSKLIALQKALEDRAELVLNKDLLIRSLRVDCELPLSVISINLYESLQELSPFGMGNPEPTFLSKNVLIEDVRLVGAEGKHLKLRFSCHPEFISGSPANRQGSLRKNEMLKQVQHDTSKMEGIAFGMGETAKIHIGDKADIVYTIDENEWNGEKRLQLKIKDLRKN